MVRLRDYKPLDFKVCKSEEQLDTDSIDIILSDPDYYIRTVVHDGNVMAIFMVYKDGEIGLIANNSMIKNHIHKFYTLSVIFLAEAFAWIDDEVLWGSSPQDNKRNIRWAKYLGFRNLTVSDGRCSYSLPLTDWVM